MFLNNDIARTVFGNSFRRPGRQVRKKMADGPECNFNLPQGLVDICGL